MEGIIHDYSSINRERGWKGIRAPSWLPLFSPIFLPVLTFVPIIIAVIQCVIPDQPVLKYVNSSTIHKCWWRKKLQCFAFKLNIYFVFFRLHGCNIFNFNHICADGWTITFSVQSKRILFSQWRKRKEIPSGHPRSLVGRCSAPAACCCEDIKRSGVSTVASPNDPPSLMGQEEDTSFSH